MRERGVLVRQLEQLAEMREEIQGGAGDEGAGDTEWGALLRQMSLEEVLDEIDSLVPPLSPDYTVEDEEEPTPLHGPDPGSARYDPRDPYRGLGRRPDDNEFPYDAPGLFGDDYVP